MRSALLLALLALHGNTALATAARAEMSATIIAPGFVATARMSESPSVSVASRREGGYEYVTVAFN